MAAQLIRYPRPRFLIPHDRRGPLVKRLAQLRTIREPHAQKWAEIASFVSPNRDRLIKGRQNLPSSQSSILNDEATQAGRICKAGLYSGVSSPSRPWFALSTPDPEMAEFGEFKEYLYAVTMRLYTLFAMSNTYLTLQTSYGDLVDFGNCQALVDEHFENVIHSRTLSPGEYCWALNGDDEVGTMFREYTWTVGQIVKEYGYDACSRNVKGMWDNSEYDVDVDLVAVVQANDNALPGGFGVKAAPFVKIIFEVGGDEDDILRAEPWHEWRAPVGRWDVKSGDVYAEGPGRQALPDTKALQILERRSAQAIDFGLRPPVSMPGNGSAAGVNVPGGVLKADVSATTSNRAQAIYQVEPTWVTAIENKIARHEQRVQRAYYADLFRQITNDTRNERATAREIAEVHEEKLVMLGPVLERLHSEYLTQWITIGYNSLQRAGLLPEPPKGLQQSQLKVKYISLLAQAQQMVGLGAIERLIGFVAPIAGVVPSVLDKVDFDQAVDEWSDIAGVPASIIRSDEKVQEKREADQQAAQAAQQAQVASNLAQGAKTLSEADLSGDNALSRMTG